MTHPAELETSLTRAQLDLWIAHELFSDPSVLNAPFAVEVSAALDEAALNVALETLVASADVLRMRIHRGQASPEMHFIEREDVRCEVVDLRHAEAGAADEWMRARAKSAFALDGRLWNAALLQLPGNRSIIHLNQHHITTDLWSHRLLLNWWGDLYARAIDGGLPPRIPLPQFADYARFARDLRDTPEYARDEAFWRERLAVAPARPLLYGRSAHSAPAPGFRMTHLLGRARSEAIHQLADRYRSGSKNRARLAVLLSLFAVLQHRISGAEEISIGVPYHNRPAQFREAAGLFVNVLPVRVSLTGDRPFDTLVAKVAADLEAAFAHARVPIAQSLSAPLYHSSLNYLVSGSNTFAGYPAKQTVMFSGRVDEPIGLMVDRDPVSGDLTLAFDCDEALFAPPRDTTVVNHFLAVLDACTGRPSAPIDATEIVTPEERRLILSWSGGDRRSPSERGAGVLSGIVARMRESPGAAAIREGDLDMTYGVLRQRAASLASVLVDRGVTRDRAVGVMIGRSADALVAMLAVLWAGGTYVPIDPAWPDSRIAFVARDLDLAGIVTRAADRGSAAREFGGVPMIDASQAGASEVAPAPRDGAQLAYVIYTSGSTGDPKGVGITDASLVSQCHSAIDFLGIGAGDRVVQFHALTFDASIEEIFPPLVAGACVLLRPADAMDPIVFNDFLETSAATIVELPTSYWHEWVHALVATGRTVPASVRFTFVGGEQPSSAVLREWWRVAPHAKWANGYGPTETTVTSTAYAPVPGDVPDPIPMGGPLANETAYVLDRWRHIVPVGVPGELYIGGAGVAREYVNRPEVTADRFVDDERLGDRVYRTGDLARYRDDGALEYLGRRDDQVKVRGYRIELAEIEHALARHPMIAHAAVLAREDDGHKRIVAFFVPTGDVTDDELRGFLRAAIPEYMIPAAFVRLPGFPLTPNGKVDKAALRSIDHPLPSAHARQAALTFNPIQAELIGMWERLLKVQGITPEDSFIALGGDSLLAARIIGEIEQLFGRRLPLATMFPDVTVARLTEVLRNAAADMFARPVLMMNEHGTRTPLVLFHGDYGGGGLYASRLAQLLGQDQPIIIVHPFGVDNSEVPPTIEEMARRRLDAVLDACRAEEYFLAGFCNGGLVALETARLLAGRGVGVRGLALIDSVVTTSRFRFIGSVVRTWSRRAGDTPRKARDRFLAWRDRQQALTDLLGLPGAQRGRFGGLRDRVQFVAGSLARRLGMGTPVEPTTAPADSNRSGSGDSAVEIVHPRDLWEMYERVINAYVPEPYHATAVLLTSDETAPLRLREAWSRAVSDLRVVSLPGHHFGIVTRHLPVVARILCDLIASGVTGDPPPLRVASRAHCLPR